MILVMSKRHHYTKENLPPGCTVYASLSEGNLNIGGVSINYTGSGVVEWDASVNAYKIYTTTPSTDTCVAYWDLDLGLNAIASQEYTIFCKAWVNAVDGGYPYLIGLGNFNVDRSYKPHINASSAFVSTLQSWRNCAFVRRDTNELTFLESGRTERNTSSHVSNPANWNSSNLCASRLCVIARRGAEGTSNPQNYFAYIKDIMIFNRALTAQEVAQL